MLLLPSLAQAQESSPWTVFQVEMALADRLQEKVLDRILGPGQSAAFVSMDIEFAEEETSSSRDGLGRVDTVLSVATSTGTSQSQRASQAKGSRDSKSIVRREAKRLAVRVLYDQKLSGEEVTAAKKALETALEPYGKGADIRFVAAPFRET
ncbi:MAG: hypothetical protein HY926_01630 [Elusimicrobia bacterium]|nr:hypothetical protein [Elusimicrobiota bacterium]